MVNFFQWIGLALGIGVVGLGVFGFYRGLSLPPNSPEHRAHGKGDSWRIERAAAVTNRIWRTIGGRADRPTGPRRARLIKIRRR